jgi:hypothetical protein
MSSLDPNGVNSGGLGMAFVFNPTPLSFNGQAVAPNLVFSEPQTAGQVDQASAAYAFTTATNAQAYNFLSSVATGAYSYTLPLFNQITGVLSGIGNIEANALQTAANNSGGQKSGGLLGFLGL